MKKKVLKLGWEFPPNSWGGLGVACCGLVKGLFNCGAKVKLVLPNKQKNYFKNCELLYARTDFSKDLGIKKNIYQNLYTNLFRRVYCYARSCEQIACENDFDVIHAHDWMTFKAAIRVKQISKKPLVVHVHSTEIDRQGKGDIKQRIYDIERSGMQEADCVIAVSNFEKQRIIKYYDIPAEKISIVHNAISDSKLYFNGSYLIFLALKTKISKFYFWVDLLHKRDRNILFKQQKKF